MLNQRASGILLPIFSLPSSHGIGDLGEKAYQFIDFLEQTHQKYWQILPLTPVDQGLGNSPYSSISAFAGNTLFISLNKLCYQGLLNSIDIESPPEFPDGHIDYPAVRAFKEPLLHKAFENFNKIVDENAEEAFRQFCEEEAYWLDDYALFKCLRIKNNEYAWIDWGHDLANRVPETLAAARDELANEILREKFFQYLFYQQWAELKAYSNKKGVMIFGDLPIYVNYDSVDVWVNPHLFKLNENKLPYVVAGTPPDRFSTTGQLWGNPVYNWDAMQNENFEWWLRRIGHNFLLFDLVRLDHFLGFVNYYEIPVNEPTAINGYWQKAPAEEFFTALNARFPDPAIVVEDLGTISPDVISFVQRHRLPGMKVLQFAFTGDEEMNPHLPHNHNNHSVVYTSLHDTNTTHGWWQTEATEHEKYRLATYARQDLSTDNVADAVVHMAMQSRANIVIVPIQDILNMNEKARINVPGTSHGNWEWQLTDGWESENIIQKLNAFVIEGER
ncbi:4-alpha-glucanotransferase [Xanthocytophaga agilis]|uniref:4-alpha-glucanotransferase n=1 Tax=Xanthocytophaga agilis TaxID=3048010 RepID=A0AAE3R206_9BACT|nr:4-alpha-glucanotransferase [Xanthocytophaga agilis]MDJ1500149.1 4-alpha-glucanotransferase [Xanthocytophaga agilis]